MLGKQWSIIEEIGEGSFGAVYKAKSIESGIEVAVKVRQDTLGQFIMVEHIESHQKSLEVDVVLLSKLNGSKHTCTLYGYGTVKDFGMARRYVTLSGQIRKARKNPGFRGTSTYSSVAANKGKETGRVDDLWSVMYSVIECMRGALPWDHIRVRDILNMKMKMPTELLLENVPGKLACILNYLKTMKREEQPRYGWIISILETIMQERQYRSGDPFDWQVPFLEQAKSSLNQRESGAVRKA
uniref:Protein kinase domain-containing protein n=1 Tax=Trichuris muris TaxID=70415 RepID=A0A5S6Q9A0_TRIMR